MANTKESQTVTNRMNDLAVETTQTLVDAAYLAQRQSAQLLQAWLSTLDSTQASQRTVAAQLVKQAQEAQSLLQEFVQQSFRSNVDTVTRATQTGFQQATETVNNAAQTVNSTSKRAESATK